MHPSKPQPKPSAKPAHAESTASGSRHRNADPDAAARSDDDSSSSATTASTSSSSSHHRNRTSSPIANANANQFFLYNVCKTDASASQIPGFRQFGEQRSGASLGQVVFRRCGRQFDRLIGWPSGRFSIGPLRFAVVGREIRVAFGRAIVRRRRFAVDIRQPPAPECPFAAEPRLSGAVALAGALAAAAAVVRRLAAGARLRCGGAERRHVVGTRPNRVRLCGTSVRHTTNSARTRASPAQPFANGVRDSIGCLRQIRAGRSGDATGNETESRLAGMARTQRRPTGTGAFRDCRRPATRRCICC